jgi:hypothetical protein
MDMREPSYADTGVTPNGPIVRTPGTSVERAIGLRPLSGMSMMRWLGTTALKAEVAASSSGAAPLT